MLLWALIAQRPVGTLRRWFVVWIVAETTYYVTICSGAAWLPTHIVTVVTVNDLLDHRIFSGWREDFNIFAHPSPDGVKVKHGFSWLIITHFPLLYLKHDCFSLHSFHCAGQKQLLVNVFTPADD
jgi:hypothetical protein